MLNNFVKNDTEILECDLDADVTGWKIRCEIFDESKHSIKLATSNSGGSNDEIEVTDALNGKFMIKVPSDSTKDFNHESKIEIEIETTNIIAGKPEVKTIFQGDISFKSRKINWTSSN